MWTYIVKFGHLPTQAHPWLRHCIVTFFEQLVSQNTVCNNLDQNYKLKKILAMYVSVWPVHGNYILTLCIWKKVTNIKHMPMIQSIMLGSRMP